MERKFRTWILDHPPKDMPEDQDIVRALVSGYQQVTGHRPRGVGPPATQLGGRYGDDDAHLWEAGIPAPIYGPSGGSYGDDYADIYEMVQSKKPLLIFETVDKIAIQYRESAFGANWSEIRQIKRPLDLSKGLLCA